MQPINPISLSAASPTFEELRMRTPLGHVAVGDSMRPAVVFERPQLTPPSSMPKLSPRVSVTPEVKVHNSEPRRANQRSDLRLLATTATSQDLGSEILDSLALRLQDVKGKIKQVSAEMIQKLKEAAARARDSGFWSILKKIATCLLSAVSIVFGVALVASGGGALIGGAMIASGILSLANFALSELGTWDWIANQLSHGNEDLRKKLLMILPGAVGLIAGGIGLVGSVNGIVTGALNLAEKALFVAQAALAIFDGVTTFGKGISDARLLWTKADLMEIKAALTAAQEIFTSTIDEIKSSMSDFNAMLAKTKKAIEMITQSNIALARQA
jgi:hypothetical protein